MKFIQQKKGTELSEMGRKEAQFAILWAIDLGVF
jgi:hypothetical protein